MSKNFWQTSRLKLSLEKTLVMAILNITPDSFSDGGSFFVQKCRKTSRKTCCRRRGYSRNRRGQHFIFKRVPARVCSRCGERYFSAQAVSEMERLMRQPEQPTNFVLVPVIELRIAGWEKLDTYDEKDFLFARRSALSGFNAARRFATVNCNLFVLGKTVFRGWILLCFPVILKVKDNF